MLSSAAAAAETGRRASIYVGDVAWTRSRRSANAQSVRLPGLRVVSVARTTASCAAFTDRPGRARDGDLERGRESAVARRSGVYYALCSPVTPRGTSDGGHEYVLRGLRRRTESAHESSDQTPRLQASPQSRSRRVTGANVPSSDARPRWRMSDRWLSPQLVCRALRIGNEQRHPRCA